MCLMEWSALMSDTREPLQEASWCCGCQEITGEPGYLLGGGKDTSSGPLKSFATKEALRGHSR